MSKSVYWPDYLRSKGLWGKPVSEWPLTVQKELMIHKTPKDVLEKCAWADDNDEMFMSAVEIEMEARNF